MPAFFKHRRTGWVPGFRYANKLTYSIKNAHLQRVAKVSRFVGVHFFVHRHEYGRKSIISSCCQSSKHSCNQSTSYWTHMVVALPHVCQVWGLAQIVCQQGFLTKRIRMPNALGVAFHQSPGAKDSKRPWSIRELFPIS